MVSIVDQRVATDEVIAHLESETGKNVGDGVAPADGTFPYAVVTPLGDTSYSGPINDGQADVEMEWQVTSVGQTRAQAAWMADKVRDAMLNGGLVLTNRSIMKIDMDGGGFIERDDDFQPPLFYAVEMYEVLSTPA